MSKAATKRDITVIERRLKSGAVFSVGSQPIPLTEPKRWTIRIVNTQINDARQWEMQSEKGWVYLEAADLAVAPGDIGFRELDGRIVRGTQGQEVLMKMETKDYKSVQRLKEQDNRKQTFGSAANKAAILSAASALPGGDQGADFLNRSIQRMEITDSLERVNLED